MNKTPLYTYWEGKMPAYIRMCRKTLLKHHPEAIFLTEDDVKEYKNLPINLKVDYLKATKVYETGGFWIDADMIVVKNLRPLFKLLKEHEFIGIPGFFGAQKGSPMLKRWIDGMDHVENPTFSSFIQPLLNDPEFKEFGVLTREMICPIYHTGDSFWHLFEDELIDKYITPNTFVVTLYNSAFSKEFKEMSEDEILSNRWLISKMFKQCL